MIRILFFILFSLLIHHCTKNSSIDSAGDPIYGCTNSSSPNYDSTATDDDGNLKMPKDQVIRAMEMEKAKAPFPKSYEIETAIKMVTDDFDDST